MVSGRDDGLTVGWCCFVLLHISEYKVDHGYDSFMTCSFV